MNRIIPPFLLAAVLLCFPAPTQAQQYGNGLIDKVVAIVGNEVIQLSTIEGEVRDMMVQGVVSDRNIRCKVLENMLVQKLLLNQARLDSIPMRHDIVEQNLDERIQYMKSALGGEKGVENYYNKPLFRLRQDWRELLGEQVLTMGMRQKLQEAHPPLTPKEVEIFYNQVDKDSLPIIPIQYQIRQIVIYPPKEEAVLLVQERLLEFRERILNGSSFAALASAYSEDLGTVLRGGELGLTAKQFFHPPFADAAMALRPGQVSQIVETPDGFHLIQLIEKTEDEMFNARHILLRPKFSNEIRQKAFRTLDSLKSQILADSITFELAAVQYSMDPKSRNSRGLVADENTGSTFFEKDQLNPADYNALRNLQPGQISDTYEATDSGLTPGRPNDGKSGNTVYKVIKLERIIPAHPANIKEDYQVILDFATNQRLEKVVEDFIAQKQKTTYIRIDPLFWECPFQRPGWIK
ncbi:MAG: peptidylprolyl isomerase [Bacteroidales bacterium]|nr:peptidylprolyl isomerase [Bacteroidales bacterium]